MINFLINILNTVGHYAAHGSNFVASQLMSVNWTLLLLGLSVYLFSQILRTNAWTNILRAAYPVEKIKWRFVALASLAGSGVNAIVPASAGTPVKLFLVKHKYNKTHYPTLASSLIAETTFEAFCGISLIIWLLVSGLLPTELIDPGQLPFVKLYNVADSFFLKSLVVVGVVGIAVALFLFVHKRAMRFWTRIKQGLVIFKNPRRFLTGVVSWQLSARLIRLVSLMLILAALNLPHAILVALLFMAAQSATSMLPIPPGGTFVRLAFLSYAFARLMPGHAPSAVEITLLATLVPTLTSIVNAIAGIFCLFISIGSISPRRIIARAKADQSEVPTAITLPAPAPGRTALN